MLNCRFQRYKPELIKVPREVFLTYIAPVHYNGIRCAALWASLGSLGVWPSAARPGGPLCTNKRHGVLQSCMKCCYFSRPLGHSRV